MRGRLDAERAQAGEREVPSVTAIVRALDAVVVEQGQAESLLYARGSGFPISTVDNLLGSDVEVQLRAAESATDLDMASLAPSLAQRLVRRLSPCAGSWAQAGPAREID